MYTVHVRLDHIFHFLLFTLYSIDDLMYKAVTAIASTTVYASFGMQSVKSSQAALIDIIHSL